MFPPHRQKRLTSQKPGQIFPHSLQNPAKANLSREKSAEAIMSGRPPDTMNLPAKRLIVASDGGVSNTFGRSPAKTHEGYFPDTGHNSRPAIPGQAPLQAFPDTGQSF